MGQLSREEILFLFHKEEEEVVKQSKMNKFNKIAISLSIVVGFIVFYLLHKDIN